MSEEEEKTNLCDLPHSILDILGLPPDIAKIGDYSKFILSPKLEIKKIIFDTIIKIIKEPVSESYYITISKTGEIENYPNLYSNGTTKIETLSGIDMGGKITITKTFKDELNLKYDYNNTTGQVLDKGSMEKTYDLNKGIDHTNFVNLIILCLINQTRSYANGKEDDHAGQYTNIKYAFSYNGKIPDSIKTILENANKELQKQNTQGGSRKSLKKNKKEQKKKIDTWTSTGKRIIDGKERLLYTKNNGKALHIKKKVNGKMVYTKI